MDKQTDTVTGKFVHRHVSQLKVLARLMEHELDAAKGTAEVAMDRELVESMLDTLEIFIEDVAGGESATVFLRSGDAVYSLMRQAQDALGEMRLVLFNLNQSPTP